MELSRFRHPVAPSPVPRVGTFAAWRSSGRVQTIAERVEGLLEPPHAPRQDREHPPEQVRGRLQQSPEMGPIDDEQAQIGRRHDGRRPRLAVEEAHLAEEVARPEFAAESDRRAHRDGAVDEDEEGIPRLADLRHGRARGDLGDPRELRDAPQVVLGEAAEQRNALEMPYPRVMRWLRRAGLNLLARVQITEW